MSFCVTELLQQFPAVDSKIKIAKFLWQRLTIAYLLCKTMSIQVPGNPGMRRMARITSTSQKKNICDPAYQK